jgi:hypothetical protein
MTHLEKLSFSLLTPDGENYLIWALDVKLHLQACNLVKKIEEPSLEIPTEPFDAQALVFMRQHFGPNVTVAVPYCNIKLMFCGCHFKIGSITNKQYFCQRLVMIGYIFEFKIIQP